MRPNANAYLEEALRALQIDASRQQLQQFQDYRDLLSSRNADFNLTSRIALENIERVHFLDSATALSAISTFATAYPKVLDVGSGAGFPGVPLRILEPNMELTLLEATGKKVRFLQGLITLLGLPNTHVIGDRAEKAAHDPAHRERFDVVLARAVGHLSTLAELCLPFCLVGGHVIAYKKGDAQEEVEAAEDAVSRLGGRVSRIDPVPETVFDDHRVLVVLEKVALTPLEYPRRAGMPAKRPLRLGRNRQS